MFHPLTIIVVYVFIVIRSCPRALWICLEVLFESIADCSNSPSSGITLLGTSRYPPAIAIDSVQVRRQCQIAQIRQGILKSSLWDRHRFAILCCVLIFV
jgi:hypothetical protein